MMMVGMGGHVGFLGTKGAGDNHKSHARARTRSR
jgi:hypothetical protein